MDYPRGVRSVRGKLQIRYTVAGQRHEETLNLPITRAGIAEASRIRRERLLSRTYSPTSARPFEAVAQEYLDNLEVAHSTRKSYRESLNIYWHGLKGRDIAGISTQDLIALDDAIEWPSQKTRSNALIPLRRVFEYARSRGWVSGNPVAMKAGKRTEGTPDPYTEEERHKLLNWLDGTLAGPYFRIAFGTGARTGELLALTWEDFDGASLWVNRSRVRGRLKGTKTGKPRRVILLPDVITAINSIPRPIHGGPIFRNQYDRPYQSGYHLNQWFRRAHKATGVRYRSGPYPWRHTYASHALSSGVRPVLVAAQLGHRVDVLLTRYSRYIPRDDDLRELQKMGTSRVSPQRQGA